MDRERKEKCEQVASTNLRSYPPLTCTRGSLSDRVQTDFTHGLDGELRLPYMPYMIYYYLYI